MKKDILKYCFCALLSAIASLLAVGVFFIVGSEIVHADNSSKAQTLQLQTMLSADAGYRQKNYARLQHNGQEPVYVDIEDNIFSAEQTSIIIEALDYIFSMVGDINSNYRYQIVESVDEAQFIGKSTITFNSTSLEIANGCVKRSGSMFGFGSKGMFNQNCIVSYDNEYLCADGGRFYYTTVHELLHIFGLDDIYDAKDIYYFDTYMNTYTNYNLKMITPNDYKLLVCFYAEDFNLLSENERQDYIELLSKKVDDYSIKYYQYYIQHNKHLTKELQGESELQSKQVALAENNHKQNNFQIDFDAFLIDGGEKIKVSVANEKYSIGLYDDNGTLIESCAGKVYNVGDEMFLQGVHLSNLIKGKETYTDLHIYLSADYQGYNLYDLFNNYYAHNGRI